MGDIYAVAFRLGTVMSDERLKLQGFRLQRRELPQAEGRASAEASMKRPLPIPTSISTGPSAPKTSVQSSDSRIRSGSSRISGASILISGRATREFYSMGYIDTGPGEGDGSSAARTSPMRYSEPVTRTYRSRPASSRARSNASSGSGTTSTRSTWLPITDATSSGSAARRNCHPMTEFVAAITVVAGLSLLSGDQP